MKFAEIINKLRELLLVYGKVEITTLELINQDWCGVDKLTPCMKNRMLDLCEEIGAKNCDFDMKASSLLFTK